MQKYKYQKTDMDVLMQIQPRAMKMMKGFGAPDRQREAGAAGTAQTGAGSWASYLVCNSIPLSMSFNTCIALYRYLSKKVESTILCHFKLETCSQKAHDK